MDSPLPTLSCTEPQHNEMQPYHTYNANINFKRVGGNKVVVGPEYVTLKIPNFLN